MNEHISKILQQKDHFINILTQHNAYLTSLITSDFNSSKSKSSLEDRYKKITELYKLSVLNNCINKNFIYNLTKDRDLLIQEKLETDEKIKMLEKNSEKYTESLKCKICQDAFINILLLPCKHLAICNLCYSQIHSNNSGNCPICLQIFNSSVQIYNIFE